MGEIGNFGDIVFEVSDLKKMSFKDFTRDTASKYQNHELIGQKPRTEFVAPGLDTVSFTVLLNAQFGVKPQDEMNKWLEYCRGGDAFPLIIGNRPLGVDLWVVTSISQHWDRIYSNGELVAGKVDVSMQEYLSAPWTVKGYREGWLAKQKAKEKELAEAKAAGYNKTNTGSTNGINLDVDLDNWEPPAIDGAYMFLDPVSAVQSLQNSVNKSLDRIGISNNAEIQKQIQEIIEYRIQKATEFNVLLYGNYKTGGLSQSRDNPLSGIDIIEYVKRKGITVNSGKDYSRVMSATSDDEWCGVNTLTEYAFYRAAGISSETYAEFMNVCGPYWEADAIRVWGHKLKEYTIWVSIVYSGAAAYFSLTNVDFAELNINLLRANWGGVASTGKGTIYLWPSIEVVSESFWVASDIASLSAFQFAVLAESLLKNGVSGTPSPEEPRKTLANRIRNVDNDILDEMEKAGGHTLEKHVSQTNEELIKRAIQDDKIDVAATSFTDKSTAIKAVQENLRKNADEIVDWLFNPNSGFKVISASHNYPVGKGVLADTKHVVYDLMDSCMYIVKDSTQEFGFKIITAYPIIK